MIKLSDNALLRLRELRNKNNKRFVRLDIKGGGCAGFEYQWSYSDEEQQNDCVIDEVLLVSRDYELYLLGLELDYTYDDFESMFKFNNPKAKSTCGCGTSFSIGM
jgi:iron-sulfur cluster assembly protein